MLSFFRSPFILVLIILVVVVAGAGTLLYVGWRHKSQPSYLLSSGERAIDKHKWRDAEEIANRLEANDAADEANYLRGKIMFSKWQLHPGEDLLDVYKAIDHLRRVHDGSSVSIPAKLLQAEGELMTEDYRTAAQLYSKVVLADPNNVDGHFGLGRIWAGIGALEDSNAQCRIAAKLDNGDGRPHGQLGRNFSELKQYDQAAAAYREALARNLSDHRREEIRMELADVLLKLHERDAAQEQLDQLSDDAKMTGTYVSLQMESYWQRNDRDNEDREKALRELKRTLNERRQSRAPADEELSDLAVQYCRYIKETASPEKALQALYGMQTQLGNRVEFVEMMRDACTDTIDVFRKQERLLVARSVVPSISIHSIGVSGVPQISSEVGLDLTKTAEYDSEATILESNMKNIQERLDKLNSTRREIEEAESKAHADRTDRESRKKLSELYEQMGRADRAKRWRNAAIAAAP
jgi:tetratricopeptide (TPR) repeat protein